jgi:hypothetical protein
METVPEQVEVVVIGRMIACFGAFDDFCHYTVEVSFVRIYLAVQFAFPMLWLHFEEVDMMFEGPIHLMNCIY